MRIQTDELKQKNELSDLKVRAATYQNLKSGTNLYFRSHRKRPKRSLMLPDRS